MTASQGWRPSFRTNDYSSYGGANACETIIPRTLDANYIELDNSPTGIAAFVVNESSYECLVVLRADQRALFNEADRALFEPMFEMELPYESNVDPVALAIAESASIPLVPSHATYTEHGLAVLMSDGKIRMFGQEESASAPASRPWPTGYLYAGAINPPTLPEGVTAREYCDIEALPDGDLVVTFAQWPGMAVSSQVFPREGWMRYDHATSTWEAPVTAYLNA